LKMQTLFARGRAGAEWPDGYVEIDGLIKSVEVTEVMEPGRQPNNEPAFTRFDTVDDCLVRAERIADALDKGIERKAKKRYGSPVTLLVYLTSRQDCFGRRSITTDCI
jgi:hypothetical protein